MPVQNGLPSIIKSVQQGIITIPPSTASATATVAAVNTAKSQLSFLGAEKSGTAAGASLQLTNGTTITANRNTTDANSVQVAWQLVEYV